MRYIKEHDKTYCDLLRLARITDDTKYTIVELNCAVETLNQLHHYAKVHQRIIPLLNAKARKLDIFGSLTEQVQNILMTETKKGIITELAKTQQLKVILQEFLAENIRVLLLKGVAFNNVLYSSDSPRLSNDIDILVRKEDWGKAVNVVQTIMKPLVKDEINIFDNLYESSFVPNEKVGAALDLHMSLTYPKLFTIDEDELWKESIPHPNFNNEFIRTLSSEHTLIHQALHAYRDMNFCKYNLVDSHEIITKLCPNLMRAISMSKSWGAKINLYFILKNCKQIMGTRIDEGLIDAIKPSFLKRFLATKILGLSIVRPEQGESFLVYRITQIASLYIFTENILRPILFQWLYVKTAIKRNVSC